jgi:hypothetical protein
MSEKNAQGMRKKKKKKERIAHVQNKKGKREVWSCKKEFQ